MNTVNSKQVEIGVKKKDNFLFDAQDSFEETIPYFDKRLNTLFVEKKKSRNSLKILKSQQSGLFEDDTDSFDKTSRTSSFRKSFRRYVPIHFFRDKNLEKEFEKSYVGKFYFRFKFLVFGFLAFQFTYIMNYVYRLFITKEEKLKLYIPVYIIFIVKFITSLIYLLSFFVVTIFSTRKKQNYVVDIDDKEIEENQENEVLKGFVFRYGRYVSDIAIFLSCGIFFIDFCFGESLYWDGIIGYRMPFVFGLVLLLFIFLRLEVKRGIFMFFIILVIFILFPFYNPSVTFRGGFNWIKFYFIDLFSLFISIFICLIVNYHFERSDRSFFIMYKKNQEKKTILILSNKITTVLLENIFPRQYIDLVKSKWSNTRLGSINGCILCEELLNLTLLYCDLVNFTTFCESIEAEELCKILNIQYSVYDRLLCNYEGVEKVRTIGDMYVACKGLNSKIQSKEINRDDCIVMLQLGLNFLVELKKLNVIHGWDWKVRIAICQGNCISAILGKKRLSYDLYGKLPLICDFILQQVKPNSIATNENVYVLTNHKIKYRKMQSDHQLLQKVNYYVIEENIDNLLPPTKNFSTISVSSSVQRKRRDEREEKALKFKEYFGNIYGRKNIKKNYRSQYRFLFLLNFIGIFYHFVMIVVFFFFEKKYLRVRYIYGFIVVVSMAIFQILSTILIFFISHYIFGIVSNVSVILCTLLTHFVVMSISEEIGLASETFSLSWICVLIYLSPFSIPVVGFVFLKVIIGVTAIIIFCRNLDIFKCLFSGNLLNMVVLSLMFFVYANLNLKYRYDSFLNEMKLKKNILENYEEECTNKMLLSSVLPTKVVKILTTSGKGKSVGSKIYGTVTFINLENIFFKKLDKLIIIDYLNRIFLMFDKICKKRGCFKIKSNGSIYIAISGLDEEVDHVERIMTLCLDFRKNAKRFSKNKEDLGDLNLKIGINTGSFNSAIVGEKKYNFDIFGGVVNVCSRLMSTDEPWRIQFSSKTRNLLTNSNLYEKIKEKIRKKTNVYIKGIGNTETFTL